jgi:Protein of unknown function (DUF1064)
VAGLEPAFFHLTSRENQIGGRLPRLTRNAERKAWTRFIDGDSAEDALTQNKYHAERSVVNGRTFDSGQEGNRAIELQWLEKLGEITNLQYQVSYEVIPKQDGEGAAYYRADFVYFDKEGHLVVEDAKGFRTKEYLLKRKLMLLVHGIRIKETAPMKRMPRKRFYRTKKKG